MKVSHIKISQILGIDELELSPGNVTVLRGKNAQGKSSVLKAIKAALVGGNDVRLLRNGAEKGEIVLEFTNGYEVSRTVTQKGSTLKVRHPKYGPLSKPQSILDGLIDVLAVNPVAFMMMPKKDRVKHLLAVCPIEVSNDEIRAAVNYDDMPVPTFPEEMNGLERIEKTRKALYEQRTSTNGAAKEKRSTIKSMSESLPANRAELDTDFDAAITNAQNQIEGSQKGFDEAIAALQSATDERIATIRTEAESESRTQIDTYTARRRELEKQLGDLERENAEFKAGVERKVNALTNEARTDLENNRNELRGTWEPIIADAKKNHTMLVTKSQDIARHRNTARLLGTFETQAVGMEETSKQLTAAIEGLDALRLDILNRLPLPGVEIREGDLFVDGVDFDEANTGRQVDF